MQVGTICFATNQGIAHIALDYHNHGVINRVMVIKHPHYASDFQRYPYAYNNQGGDVERFLNGLDILFLVETGLDFSVVRAAKARGIKVVVMPMFEYTPFPFPVPVDLFLCPSELDCDVYKDYRQVYMPVPVTVVHKMRTVAKTFVHNCGHGQWQWGKGTPELCQAMDYVQSPIRLKLRGQTGEKRVRDLFTQYANHPKIDLLYGEAARDDLYAEGDVFVYPERYNGLSLPLQEAAAAGMLVMASDHYPANCWLPKEPLIPVERYERVKIATEFERAVIDPKTIAAKMDEWYGRDITFYSQWGRDYAERNSWATLRPKILSALESLL